ncbi:UNVERIFIED_ORG: hypothetical protein J2740_003646 [Rhizobium nepotum]|nr:hypothetical protein [Rhizobium nepotum]
MQTSLAVLSSAAKIIWILLFSLILSRGFKDEARIGQKNKITRRWAKRGRRPSAPHDQRTRSPYIFGAICTMLGKAAALVMPRSDTHAMPQHLAEISRVVAEDAHAILNMDQAG